MLRKEDFAVIKSLHERGVYQKDIALELSVHPKTVSRALKRGSAPKSLGGRRSSKLDPFKGRVDYLLSEEVWNAVVILRELQAEGYQGGVTVLRQYIAPKRALRASRATVRFETGPAKQLQSDWGETVTQISGQRTKVHFLVNQLGYSRRFHFWCTLRRAHLRGADLQPGVLRRGAQRSASGQPEECSARAFKPWAALRRALPGPGRPLRLQPQGLPH